MIDYKNLMLRCQRGKPNAHEANNLLAECYAAIGKLLAENAGLKTGFKAYEATVQELKGEIEALRPNAARYQWLRDQAWNDSALAVVLYPRSAAKLGSDFPSGDRLDRLIDGMGRTDCGHGHVYPRTDGVKARCGAPGLCLLCSADEKAKDLHP
jgi:hypothetical protein